MRFEILTAVLLKIQFQRDATLCHYTGSYQHNKRGLDTCQRAANPHIALYSKFFRSHFDYIYAGIHTDRQTKFNEFPFRSGVVMVCILLEDGGDRQIALWKPVRNWHRK
jgi:hypothetical protein